MPQLTETVKTSLAVGFPGGELPERLKPYVGRAHRSIAAAPEFPYEDSQFEVVFMEGACVNAKAVREAHRVLRPDGRLMFIVNEKTGSQEGMTLPEAVRFGQAVAALSVQKLGTTPSMPWRREVDAFLAEREEI